jgi:hypothetical protein
MFCKAVVAMYSICFSIHISACGSQSILLISAIFQRKWDISLTYVMRMHIGLLVMVMRCVFLEAEIEFLNNMYESFISHTVREKFVYIFFVFL